MAKWPQTKKEWIEAGYEVAVAVKDATTYGEYHRFDNEHWSLSGHFIPIETAGGALEAYQQRGGAPPCKTCFPPAKAKVEA